MDKFKKTQLELKDVALIQKQVCFMPLLQILKSLALAQTQSTSPKEKRKGKITKFGLHTYTYTPPHTNF